MNLTRVETKKLRTAVTLAAKKLEEAIAALDPYLDILAVASDQHPDVVAAIQYDAEAVVEDLDNAEALAALAAPLARLQQMVDDSRLRWLAEAFVPSLELYGVAKVRAKKDGTLAQSIAPLADVFAVARRKRATEPEPSGQ